MSGFFSQLSLWEIGGLLLIIVFLNTVLLKWFMDWNQSHPLDEAEPAGASATPSPTQARSGVTTSSRAALSGTSDSAVAEVTAATARSEEPDGGGMAAGAGRPRRRKYLQPTGHAGEEALAASSSDLPVATDTDKGKEVRDVAPVAVLTSSGPKIAAPASGIAVSGRSFAEVNSAGGESGKPVTRPLISAAGLPPVQPSSDLSAGVVAAAAGASTTSARSADETPAKERTPASRLWDRTSSSATRTAPISRSDILAKDSPRVAPVRKTGAPELTKTPPTAEPAAGSVSTATPAAEPVRTDEPVVAPSAGLAELIGPPKSDTPPVSAENTATASPAAAASEITSSLILPRATLEAGTSPSQSDAGTAARIEDKDEVSAPAAATVELPLTPPPTAPVPPAADLLLQKSPAEHTPATEPLRVETGETAAENNITESEQTPASPAAAAAELPADRPISSADFAPMPTPSSTDETPAETRGTPSGRPVIARRSVGPARIFLTREFSSLRIKSALNPPQTPALAAARARQTPPKVTPVIPGPTVAPEPTAAPVVPEQSTASGYEPLETPAATSEPETTPSASLQLRATPPSRADEPARGADEALSIDKPASVSAPAEEMPAVAAGALGSESEVETAAPTAATAPTATPTPTEEVAKDEPQEEVTPAAGPEPTTVPAYAAVEPTPAPAPSAEREDDAVAEPVPTTAEPRASHADEAETAPAPTAGLMETSRFSAPERESAEERVEPVDIAPAPAMLPPISSTGSSATAVAETTIPTVRPSPFIMTSAPTTSGERAIAQLTFSFEVASLQLTPAFRLGSVQLRPLTNVVTLHLAQGEGQGGPSPLSANIAFEILTTQTGGSTGHGPIQALVLKPLSEARAATTPQPKLAVNAVQLSQGAEGSAPIQITPAQNTSTSVQVLATFAIAGIDFTPLFEIGSMRLEPTTANVLLKLSQGAQTSGMELPPSFVLTDVEVGGDGQINSMLLVPRAA